ncbi:MAG TPA: hypothetical protein VFJ24_07115 [Gaiellales bacterium]|nr:hypothetical protein [Gaiellales bacterium]
MTSQRLWIPGKQLGQNEIIALAKGHGGRGFAYAKWKREETEKVAWLCKAARLRPVARARFRFVWHEQNRRRDLDNVVGYRKAVLDGLQHAKVLENDGWDQVAGWTDEFVISPTPGILVEIEEVAAD